MDIQLENLMMLCYALELAKLVMTLSHQMCTQCIFEGEDIDKHECFKFTLEEKLRRYLSLAWMDIDEEAVILKCIHLVNTDSNLQQVNGTNSQGTNISAWTIGGALC